MEHKPDQTEPPEKRDAPPNREEHVLRAAGEPDLELIRYRPALEDGVDPPPANAPKLLFLHGAWSNAAMWEVNFLPWFAGRGWDCAALSLQAHGASGGDKWIRLLRVDDYLRDIRRAAEELGDPVIIGLSMGGYLAQKYLERHRAPAAVLLAPAPVTGTGRTTWIMLRDRPLSFLLSLVCFDTRKLVRTHELVRRSCFSPEMDREATRKFFEETEDESVLINLDMGGAALPEPEKVKDPVLVLGAENDFFFPPDELRETARAYGTEARIFADRAHVLPLEPGWQEVAQVMDAWLRERG